MALSFLDSIDHADLLPTFHSVREALDYLTISAVNVYASKYLSYAFFTLLIYDHMLTVPEEVKLVWLGRPSMVKALFLFNRYFVPLFIAIDLATLSGAIHMTDQLCRTWILVDVVFELLSLLSTTLIMAFRVHAVLGNIPRMLPYLLGIWTFQAFISAVLVIVLVLMKLAPTIVLAPVFNVCMADLQAKKVWTIWIPAMMYHTLVFVLLVWKAVSTPRDTKTPMLMLLIRDGFIYFGVVFAAFLFNLLVWALAPLSLALLPHDSVWAIVTIALSRLMLSMEGITPNGISTDGEEENSKPVQRPLSQAALSANFTRDLERRLSFPRSRSQTPMSKSQKQHSIAETVVMPGSDTDRRSSKGSTYSQRGKQRPSSVVQKEAYANPSWFPGAIEENPSVLRSISPASLPPAVTSGRVSPVPTDRSTSPPLGYVRPLPSIPGTSSLFGHARAHSRSLSASPLPGHSINPSRPTHQSSASASGPMSNTSSQSSTLYSPPQSITQLTLRGSEASSSPNLGASRDVTDLPGPLANREVHEMRLLPPRPSRTPLSSDSNPWMETRWPEIAYPNAPPQAIVDRRGGIKTSDSGGVEF